MDEHLQPNLLNNIDMQPQQQQQQEYAPVNPNLMMGPQDQQLGNQQQGNQQQDDKQLQADHLQALLLRSESVLQQKSAVPLTSQDLDRAAQANFTTGINSRKGPCEKRDSKKRKARARKELNGGAGLTPHSIKLAVQLKEANSSIAKQQEENNKFYDKWTESRAGRYERRNKDLTGVDPVEEHKEKDEYKIAMLGWLKDDRNRKNLLSSDYLLQSRAYEEMLDRALGFELQPNALCTLSAMQRAAEVTKISPLVYNLQQILKVLPTEVTRHIPPYKLEQFDKFHEVFGHLQQGIEATAHLQGVNADGNNRYHFAEETSFSHRSGMKWDYASNKRQRSRSAAAYERELAQYNAAFGDKEAMRQRRLAYIEQSTGVPLSEEAFAIMRGLDEISSRETHEKDIAIFASKTMVVSKEEEESGALTKSATYKRDAFGGPLTDEEKLVMDNVSFIAAENIAHYLENDKEREKMFNKKPELRAEQLDKVLDRILQKLPLPLSEDASDYSYAKDAQAAIQMKNLIADIRQATIVLQFDPLSSQHIVGEKIEQMSSALSIGLKLGTYQRVSLGMLGLDMSGGLYQGSVAIGEDIIELDKEQLAQQQAQQAELYKQAVQQYNAYHDNSSPESQQKIAEAKTLLGTDLGVTKHTLEMAEALREPQPVEQQLRELKGVRLLDSRTGEEMAAAQVRLMDKLMEFPLDTAQVSATPDMANIPQIIAHGRLIDEAKRQMAEDKAMRQQAEEKSGGKYHTALPIPADKLEQWESYTEVFAALRDTAAVVVGKVGLTTEGTSRYADKPDTTPEQLAADKSQLSRAYTNEHTKLELLSKSYAARYLADDATQLEAKAAEKLLGTSLGITTESYKLATALQDNQKQQKENAKADKAWFDAWSESEAGKQQIASGKSLQDKKDEHTRKYKELTKERLDKANAYMVKWQEENPGKKVNFRLNKTPIAQEYDELIEKHGEEYKPTEEETKQLPLSAHKSAAQVLHLLEGDDKAKLFSDDPQQRAEVLTVMAEKLIADGLDEKLLTDPALVQKLPALLAKEKDAKALAIAMTEDIAASKHIVAALCAAVDNYAGAIRRVGQAAPAILHGHGLTADGNSLYKDNPPKEAQDYQKISTEKALGGVLLEGINEKYGQAVGGFSYQTNILTKRKERLAQEKLDKEKLEKEKQEKLEKEKQEKAELEKLKEKKREEDKLAKEREDILTKKEREDFARRKEMSPQDAQKDMVEDSKKWLENWNASEEAKEYKGKQLAWGGRSVMSAEQMAAANQLAHLLTDEQRIRLYSTGPSKRAKVGQELYHIIMGDTELKKNAPQEQRDKVKVQQEVAKLATVQNAKALLRLANEEKVNFLTPKQIAEMLDLLR